MTGGTGGGGLSTTGGGEGAVIILSPDWHDSKEEQTSRIRTALKQAETGHSTVRYE
jgi:hypothetical protein